MENTEDFDYENECRARMLTVRDALEVINGKWKILILISMMGGHSRFREIERSIPKISSKVLAKELKDLEENKLIKRTVHDAFPVLVEYSVTDYVYTLGDVIEALHKWGLQHRRKIINET